MSWSPGGMGLALYNALLRPAVRRVTVVERDPEVIALFDAIRGAEWPFPNRVAIERGDALMWWLARAGRLSICRHLGQARLAGSGRRHAYDVP
jgi:hypothetical protein